MAFSYVTAALDITLPDPIAQLLLVRLANHANDKGVCFPSIQTLADACGLSIRTVRNYLHKLKELGLIAIRARFSGGRQSSNIYELKLSGRHQVQPPLPFDDLPPSPALPTETAIETVNETKNITCSISKSDDDMRIDSTTTEQHDLLAPPEKEQAAFQLPTKAFNRTGEVISILPSDIALLTKSFPKVPVEDELIRMRQWLESNPQRRKTSSKMWPFIRRWMQNAVDFHLNQAAQAIAAPQGQLTRNKSLAELVTDRSWAD